MKKHFAPGDAILIVDPQIDFFPGGALPVPDGDEVIPVINQWLMAASQHQIPIYISRDWHPFNHCSFREHGGQWPIHCVQNSKGAEFHPAIRLPANFIYINKADEPNLEAYSAFKGKTLAGDLLIDSLQQNRIKNLWVLGLALDYCVLETALDARHHGFEVHLLTAGTRPINEETGQMALKKLQTAGVIIE
jgi:nicotinamidase/pyrazinamidase